MFDVGTTSGKINLATLDCSIGTSINDVTAYLKRIKYM